MPSFADLSDDKLEKGLELLLNHMEEKGLLPPGCDKTKILENLMSSIKEAFNNGPIPQEIFTDPAILKKVMVLACSAHMELALSGQHPSLAGATLNLAHALLNETLDDPAKLAKLDAVDIKLKLSVALMMNQGPQPLNHNGMNDLFKLIDKLIEQIQNAKSPEDLKEITLTDQDQLALQMVGVTPSGLAVILQEILGDPGFPLIPILTNTEGKAGIQHMLDNFSANISPQSRGSLDARLEALSGSTTAIQDAAQLKSTLEREHVVERSSLSRPSPFNVAGGAS